jgi:DNA polymerase alpha subunit A
LSKQASSQAGEFPDDFSFEDSSHRDDPPEAEERAFASRDMEIVPVAPLPSAPLPKASLTETKKKFKVTSEAPKAEGVGLIQTVTDYFQELGQSTTESSLSSISAGGPSLNIDPSWWLEKNVTSGEEYVPMFWTDATEVSGVVYLFGRLVVAEPGAPKRYLSCCVAVHGCERNLFLLPRKKEGQRSDGSSVRSAMSEVYSDIHRILVPHIIPRGGGQGFRCKSVKRKYAFEMESIPREETEYMKVVYSSRHSAPSADQCSPSIEAAPAIEKIFGASIGALEWFLLKRKLMGPSWILVRRPKVLPDSVSWCKIEIGVDDPKCIEKMPQSEAPPSPPLTVMSVSMKTAINPSTHVHEVISLAAVVHSKVDVDSDTTLSSDSVKGFCFIRQLGTSCGAGYPHAFPHDLESEILRNGGGMLMTCPNERALLSAFFTRLHADDPDVLASHNLFGFEFDVLLSRAIACKLPTWNKIGRLRRAKTPKSINDRDVASGRLLSDTYKAAKEFLRETTYSLSHLASTQLNNQREEVDPVDVPRYFSDSKLITQLARHTLNDAGLVLGLLIKLQVIPLTKQLTNLSGNIWARTMRGARAERIEYLLLHEFHSLKYILPERKQADHAPQKGKVLGDDDEEEPGGQKVGGHSRSRAKAAYAGGLVLEPKKGLYDTYVLLLDFNSLYPSLIQEYNLCFTTIEWTKYNKGATPAREAAKVVSDDVDDDQVEGTIELDTNASSLPPLPDSQLPQGILPRVIKTLVDRRREVKALLKKAKEPSLRQQLDIRQKALKLTANSMYGCLGFSFSRFYAMPIAALVTAKGREALQRTVDQAKNQMGLDVIYGDTDSVMINTGLTSLPDVNSIGLAVKKEVNKLYKCLELDIDGVFKSILLLKKKKYAAVTIVEHPDGSVTYEKEMKGLDLVRRDWCPLSKDAGKFAIDRILSGDSRDDIVLQIHEYLSALSRAIREGSLQISQFVITKGLNKSPKDYPDVKGQPHLQVALKMLKANKPVNIGDHIPYVICKAEEGFEKSSPAERAHHPEEVIRSDGALTIDYEWYLAQQILPPISRLCEPIEGTSQAILSQQLGLDSSR